MKHRIKSVATGSIADELGVMPGDSLLRVGGCEVNDVLDYRFLLAEEEVLVEIEKPDGEIWELDIEKDEDVSLGLSFESELMSDVIKCRNRCVFCFVDQEPPGLRSSLYIKDDDYRLSFLSGNYITLTNITKEMANRICHMKLSPLFVSVHTIDNERRRQIMGSKDAGNLNELLEKFGKAGIRFHFQVVLVKGMNDGESLYKTIDALVKRANTESLAIVPAGTTRFRDGLFPIQEFSQREFASILSNVRIIQTSSLKRHGSRRVFLADEIYFMAKPDTFPMSHCMPLPLPPFDDYEDFPQLANGVGGARLFYDSFVGRIKVILDAEKKCTFPHRLRLLPAKNPRTILEDVFRCDGSKPSIKKSTCSMTAGACNENMVQFRFSHEKPKRPHLLIVTGVMAAGLMSRLMDLLNRRFSANVSVHPVANCFYGPTVTVSGLLTGQDVIAALGKVLRQGEVSIVFLPPNAFREGTEEMLDGVTRGQVEAALGIPTAIGSNDGAQFANQLVEAMRC